MERKNEIRLKTEFKRIAADTVQKTNTYALANLTRDIPILMKIILIFCILGSILQLVYSLLQMDL